MKYLINHVNHLLIINYRKGLCVCKPTRQRERHKFHALSAHDGTTETAVMTSVPDVESVPAIRAEWYVLIVHPWHNRLL